MCLYEFLCGAYVCLCVCVHACVCKTQCCVCMTVCVHASVRVCVQRKIAWVCVCVLVTVCACVCACLCVCVCTHVCVQHKILYVCERMCTCLLVCMCACVRVCACFCTTQDFVRVCVCVLVIVCVCVEASWWLAVLSPYRTGSIRYRGSLPWGAALPHPAAGWGKGPAVTGGQGPHLHARPGASQQEPKEGTAGPWAGDSPHIPLPAVSFNLEANV